MNDDWRLRIDLHDQGFAHRLSELLEPEDLEHDLERSVHDRVLVSIDGAQVFCYAGTRGQAEAARELISRLASEHGWELDIELAHWHPTAEQWKDPDAPLPAADAHDLKEQNERIAEERAESKQRGYPEYEVRIECASRAAAGELSDKLKHEGIPILHRSSLVLVGATDEQSAQELAERLQQEVPVGSTVTIEVNQRSIYDHLPRSPFIFLGGLGG